MSRQIAGQDASVEFWSVLAQTTESGVARGPGWSRCLVDIINEALFGVLILSTTRLPLQRPINQITRLDVVAA